MGIRGRLLVALLAALVLLGTTDAHADLSSIHEFEVQVRVDGDLEVEETIRLQGDWKSTALTRSFWRRPAQDAWPLQQRLDDISVTSEQGEPLDYRERYYETRANVDFLEVPDSGVLVLQYRVHRALDFSEDQVNWQWTITGFQWRATVLGVKIRLLHPDQPGPGDSKLQYSVGYGDDNDFKSQSTQDGEALLWVFTPEAAPDEPIALSLNVIRGSVGPVPEEWYWVDLAKLTRIPLMTLVLLFVLGMVLMVSRPKDAIYATGISNFLPGVTAMITAISVTAYWYFERGHRARGDDFSGEFIVNIGLAGFVLLFAWKQRRTLRERRRAAYFSQFAFPGVLLVAWPLSFVDYGMIIFPLLSFPIYFYWPRRKIALEFGVGAHRISEEVGGRAEVPVAELARHFKISNAALLRALEQNPHLPVVVDHKQQIILSAEAASLHKELCVCTYCGGATNVAGMGVRKCGYCARQFTSSKKRRSEKPLPLVIETLSIFFETLSMGGYFFSATIALAILVMELVAGNFVAGLIGGVISGAILAILPALIASLAAKLRKGKGITAASILLLSTAWLIAPLVVLWKLRSKRVQIFTGALSSKELGEELRKQGEWSLPEFAEYLQSNQEDAAELAQYLAVNQIIDAAYDRREARLIDRALYRDIAKEGSCKSCGGYFGIQSGRATCHFCGTTVDQDLRRAARESSAPNLPSTH